MILTYRSPFLFMFVFLRRSLGRVWEPNYTSVPGGVPWLHGCIRNARNVAK